MTSLVMAAMLAVGPLPDFAIRDRGKTGAVATHCTVAVFAFAGFFGRFVVMAVPLFGIGIIRNTTNCQEKSNEDNDELFHNKLPWIRVGRNFLCLFVCFGCFLTFIPQEREK